MAKITLTIEFDSDTKATTVLGPIADKMMCYAMMEMARDSIKDFKPQTIEVAQPAALRQIFPALK